MLPYRHGVGIFLLNKKKKLWIGKRIDAQNDFWQMPQGGIDSKESELNAMMRELKEEIGTNNVEVLMRSDKLYQYELPKNLISNVWSGKYKGQIQRWFACSFLGEDKEIRLDHYKPEFKDWKWVDPMYILEKVIPFKRKMYKKIIEDFSNLYS